MKVHDKLINLTGVALRYSFTSKTIDLVVDAEIMKRITFAGA